MENWGQNPITGRRLVIITYLYLYTRELGTFVRVVAIFYYLFVRNFGTNKKKFNSNQNQIFLFRYIPCFKALWYSTYIPQIIYYFHLQMTINILEKLVFHPNLPYVYIYEDINKVWSHFFIFYFNFLMLLKWQSFISIFSQIWQYSKYESRKS